MFLFLPNVVLKENLRWTFCSSRCSTSKAKGLTVPRLHCSSALRSRAFPRGSLRQPISSGYGVTSAKVTPNAPGNSTSCLHDKILFRTNKSPIKKQKPQESLFDSQILSIFKLFFSFILKWALRNVQINCPLNNHLF